MGKKKIEKKVDAPVETAIDFNDVRKMITEELTKRYGSTYKFLNSEKGKQFGGLKMKPYLCDNGPKNFKLTKELCEYLGIGSLSRKIIVSRSYFYSLGTIDRTDK